MTKRDLRHRRAPRSVLIMGMAVLLAAGTVSTSQRGANASDSPPPASQEVTDEFGGSLQSEVNRAHREGGFVSVSAEARAGWRRTGGHAGVADLKTGKPVPHHGHFRAGSVTKAFVATVILQLEAEGRLSLDDSVERWLPGLISGNGNDGSAITLRNLLQNTSGLANYSSVKDFDQTATTFERERWRHYEPEELVAIAVEHPPSFPPADNDDPNPDWEYSNTNYIVAGMVIEKVTGRDWRVELRDRVLVPLGLRDTFAPGDSPWLPRPHARTYKRFPEHRDVWTDTTVRNMSSGGGAAELISTKRDLDRFMTALLGGELLPPRQLAAMLDTVPATGLEELMPGARYGLGLLRHNLPCGGHAWNLGGQVVGGDTRVAHTPDGRRNIAISALGMGGPDQIAKGQQALQRLTNRALCDGAS